MNLFQYKKYSSYTMLKKTTYSQVGLDYFKGIPVAIKKYHKHISPKVFKNEKSVLLELNGKWRSPKLLDCDDKNKILIIEWIKGDRLKEYLVKKYLKQSSKTAFSDSKKIKRSTELFKKDNGKETLHIKNQIYSILKLHYQYGVCHNDIDPRNFIITPDKKVFIIDFNKSKFIKPKNDYQDLPIDDIKNKLGIDWQKAELNNCKYFKQKHYQSCSYPNGLITTGDGQGSTERKFEYLGIKNLSNLTFLDIGCAEGEVCRMAKHKKAKSVYGFDINESVIKRGRKINKLYNFKNITLKQDSFYNLKRVFNKKGFDVVTCFSVLHHLTSNARTRDLIKLVADPKEKSDKKNLIKHINSILRVTNKLLFLELPFTYHGMTKPNLTTGEIFCENINNEINGTAKSLGIWHANAKKARFIFLITKEDYCPKTLNKVLSQNKILLAWHKNIPYVDFNKSKNKLKKLTPKNLLSKLNNYCSNNFSHFFN
jgi:2-polyprenyl-3-methyl-5-hydroxy-6-metoxy-1,4-benzoquinol methylase/predicted Ser/Thr protein kinase